MAGQHREMEDPLWVRAGSGVRNGVLRVRLLGWKRALAVTEPGMRWAGAVLLGVALVLGTVAIAVAVAPSSERVGVEESFGWPGIRPERMPEPVGRGAVGDDRELDKEVLPSVPRQMGDEGGVEGERVEQSDPVDARPVPGGAGSSGGEAPSLDDGESGGTAPSDGPGSGVGADGSPVGTPESGDVGGEDAETPDGGAGDVGGGTGSDGEGAGGTSEDLGGSDLDRGVVDVPPVVVEPLDPVFPGEPFQFVSSLMD